MMFWNKNKGRYTIQVLPTGEREWKHWYQVKPTRSKQNALAAVYAWRDHEWDFVADKPRFRIFDNVENEPYYDREARAMLELGIDYMNPWQDLTGR